MSGPTVFVLAILVASGLSEPLGIRRPEPKYVEDPALLAYQTKIMELYYRINEPIYDPELKAVATTYKLEDHVDKYTNTSAVKIAVTLIGHEWTVPRGVPFSVLDTFQKFEAVTYFNVLYSAKDFDTFYKTALYLRNNVNEYLFAYVLSVAILHRPDTQGLYIPPLYEVFPAFFNNGEIMNTVQKISTNYKEQVHHLPSTYLWDDNVVIMWNETVWPYVSEESRMSYYTHDFALNEYYYNDHVSYPSWLGGELKKDKRGERFWFNHKQYLTRYYMERLSNGLGEIPVLGLDTVETGYTSGLVHYNGIPYPVRPNYFDLEQPDFVYLIKDIVEYERRVREAIDIGYVVSPTGEHIDIRHPEAIEIIGNIIEANVDSVNVGYYKDFISIWKVLLGNSIVRNQYKKDVPLVNPSVLEQFQTASRDPAFYMIFKRVLKLFSYWQATLPRYTRDELALPEVTIKSVEVDKLVTFFDYSYLNATSQTFLAESERLTGYSHKSVLVQKPRLNHRDFSVRINVNSAAQRNVNVKFFLAPKYDSYGNEIPLHLNTENFFMFDTFLFSLNQGDNLIVRNSTENAFLASDFDSAWEVYLRAENALNGKGKFFVEPSQRISGWPKRLLLPKGRVGGMPFVVLVHIAEYHAPNAVFGTGYNFASGPGIASGARRITSYPLGFPLDRPLYEFQIKGLKNIWLEDVNIWHKTVPEMNLPYYG